MPTKTPHPPLNTLAAMPRHNVRLSYDSKGCHRPSATEVFHSMEDFFEIFPRYGKNIVDFSTVWKIFPRVFHSMENSSKRPGLRAFLAVIRGLQNGARGAPCEP